MTKPALHLVAAAAALAALSGCSSLGGTAKSTLPSGGPTMADIYRSHNAQAGLASSRSVREQLPLRQASDDAQMSVHLREQANEIDTRFARLPNPDLVMYVVPHLSSNGRYPIPGYSTVFPMYDQIEYAMPGEVAPARSRRVDTAAPAAPLRQAPVRSAQPAGAAPLPVGASTR